MIALEKKKLAEKMDAASDDDDDSDNSDSDPDPRLGKSHSKMQAADDDTINLSAMLMKDQVSEFSSLTTGSLKVAELPSVMHRFESGHQSVQQAIDFVRG